MMQQSCKYALLLASLPRHSLRLFSAKQTPVSRIKLEQRLLLLEAVDATELKRVESVLSWASFRGESDAAVVRKCQEVLDSIRDVFVRGLVLWHLELRTVLAALRIRNAGARGSGKQRLQGFGPWQDAIERNWSASDFGLGHRLPWLVEAQILLVSNQTHELEKFLLDLIWKHYANVVSGHFFDFPAVVIYVLRWDLTNRWINYDAQQAMERFDALINAGLDACEGL
ncbi:MAG: DUF2764 family protein [Gammaproteobacteria bacterium]